jgi:DNA-binding MarR family transcriptional regulator
MFDYVDQFKVLLSQDTWDNILLNCTKNEMLVLLQLYRGADINMSQIAEYLDAPLNTTTGIVSRMEKKQMVQRIRNENDKRVVTIMLTETGSKQINDIIGMFLTYGEKIISSLSADELGLMGKLINKVVTIIQETPLEAKSKDKKIRKITIE